MGKPGEGHFLVVQWPGESSFLYAGNEVLFFQESISNKGKFVQLLEDLKKYAPSAEG